VSSLNFGQRQILGGAEIAASRLAPAALRAENTELSTIRVLERTKTDVAHEYISKNGRCTHIERREAGPIRRICLDRGARDVTRLMPMEAGLPRYAQRSREPGTQGGAEVVERFVGRKCPNSKKGGARDRPLGNRRNFAFCRCAPNAHFINRSARAYSRSPYEDHCGGPDNRPE